MAGLLAGSVVLASSSAGSKETQALEVKRLLTAHSFEVKGADVYAARENEGPRTSRTKARGSVAPRHGLSRLPPPPLRRVCPRSCCPAGALTGYRKDTKAAASAGGAARPIKQKRGQLKGRQQRHQKRDGPCHEQLLEERLAPSGVGPALKGQRRPDKKQEREGSTENT
jgi:hypothetical protein